MHTLSTEDFNLLKKHASTLANASDLNLSLSDAQLAVALMWDFETWSQLEKAQSTQSGSTSGNQTIGPNDLMVESTHLTASAKTETVARQIGRLINNMARFPKLSEKVGTVVPRLYGYTSMVAMSSDGQSASQRPPHSDSKDAILQSQELLSDVFTGKNGSGITLISGSQDDQPVAFSLDAVLKLTDREAVRVMVSESYAQALDIPVQHQRWRLQNSRSLSSAMSQIISHLQHETNTVYVLSLVGFEDLSPLADLIFELQDANQSGEGNRVVVDVGPLRQLDKLVWDVADHQVLLEGALESYPEEVNPLGLKVHDMNQIAGFTSRLNSDFSFYVMTDRRDGLLVRDADEHLESSSPKSCTA